MSRPALVPELYVSHLALSLDFYVDKLGFLVEYERPEDRFAALSLGGAHLMLEEAPGFGAATSEEFQAGQWRTADLERPFGRGMNLEIEVTGLEEIASRLRTRNHPMLLEPHERSYRMAGEDRVVRQLLVADPDGYLIRLSEPAA